MKTPLKNSFCVEKYDQNEFGKFFDPGHIFRKFLIFMKLFFTILSTKVCTFCGVSFGSLVAKKSTPNNAEKRWRRRLALFGRLVARQSKRRESKKKLARASPILRILFGLSRCFFIFVASWKAFFPHFRCHLSHVETKKKTGVLGVIFSFSLPGPRRYFFVFVASLRGHLFFKKKCTKMRPFFAFLYCLWCQKNFADPASDWQRDSQPGWQQRALFWRFFINAKKIHGACTPLVRLLVAS